MAPSSRGAGPGAAVVRLEDPALLTGAGRYLDDLGRGWQPPAGSDGDGDGDAPTLPADVAHAVFVRSTDAHGELRGVDGDEAATAPGVLAVLTAADLDLVAVPGHAMLAPAFARPPLATDRVRFAGEAVAVVVATSREAAVDAAELVVVDVSPLPASVDVEAAWAGAEVPLFPELGHDRAFEGAFGGTEDPCADADLVVEVRTTNPRVAPVPMEPDGALAIPLDGGGGGPLLEVWASTQRVHQVRDAIAGSLRLEPGRVRVRAPLVGGGFGGKFEASAEAVVVAAAARHLGRPVRWVQGRGENLLGMPHGRGQRQHGRLALRADGTFTGLDVDVLADAGAYPMVGAVIPNATGLMAPGPYRIPAVRARGRAVATSTSPVGAYRGAGRPEATALLEALVERAADALGVDPVALRRRNLLAPDEYPHTTATGMTYDSGDVGACLAAACEAIGYDEVRAEQARRHAAGDPVALGVAVAAWMDCTPMNRPGEWASVELVADPSRPGGVRAVVRDGANDQGQAHRTTWALLVSEQLGLPLEAVDLALGDTARVPHGEGTGSARSLMLAGASVRRAAGLVLDQAREVAAHLLEAAPEDVVVTPDGHLGVVGSPVPTVSWAEVVGAAAARPPELARVAPDGRLGAEADVTQPGPTFPSGVHAAVVEVDTETGAVQLRRFVAVDDCGTVVNPIVVAGQQHGGIAQGVAQALWEEVVHDPAGTPLTASLADYGVPSAAELSAIDARTRPSPSPVNGLGAKGIGQAGAIGSTPAVLGAVVDALRPLGVQQVEAPATPERVWRAIEGARGRPPSGRPGSLSSSHHAMMAADRSEGP